MRPLSPKRIKYKTFDFFIRFEKNFGFFFYSALRPLPSYKKPYITARFSIIIVIVVAYFPSQTTVGFRKQAVQNPYYKFLVSFPVYAICLYGRNVMFKHFISSYRRMMDENSRREYCSRTAIHSSSLGQRIDHVF